MNFYIAPEHCIIGSTLEGVSIELPKGGDEINFKTDAYCWITVGSNDPETQKKKATLSASGFIPHDVKEDGLRATRIFVKYGKMGGKICRVRHPFLEKHHRAHQAVINAKTTFAIGFIDPMHVRPPLIKPAEAFRLDEKIKMV